MSKRRVPTETRRFRMGYSYDCKVARAALVESNEHG
jgi:hypothetical protein